MITRIEKARLLSHDGTVQELGDGWLTDSGFLRDAALTEGLARAYIDGEPRVPMPITVRDWQPIETAPKDGTIVVLLCGAEDWDRVVGRWSAWDHSENYYWSDCEGCPLHPTHWLPLPGPPPALAKEA